MRIGDLLLATVLFLPLLLAASSPREATQGSYDGRVDALAANGLLNLIKYTAAHGPPSANCSLKTAAIRRDWDNLSNMEKKSYISAVNCLANKPSITPSSLVPGAKSRYDDFVFTHMNQTLFIHGTGNFLTWHRYFVWTFEEALRNECGYLGHQPYWNWGKYADNPLQGSLFDGSDASMSGNGAYMKHNASCIPSDALCMISLPAGSGGGCVTSGPFKDFTINLGPVQPVYPDIKPNSDPNSGTGYNPRCLRRDISSAASKWIKDMDTARLITDNPDPYWFMTNFQGNFPTGFLGAHTGGHFTFGGDPGGDLFLAPGDPIFWLHHGMVDRVWWTWQNMNISKRQYSISATLTINNNPPSRNATLDDLIDLGVNAPPITNRDAMNTIAGNFCYTYA